MNSGIPQQQSQAQLGNSDGRADEVVLACFPWLTNRRIVFFVLGWMLLFGVISAFISNPFQSEPSATASPNYWHVMFLHGFFALDEILPPPRPDRASRDHRDVDRVHRLSRVRVRGHRTAWTRLRDHLDWTRDRWWHAAGNDLVGNDPHWPAATAGSTRWFSPGTSCARDKRLIRDNKSGSPLPFQKPNPLGIPRSKGT